MRASHLCLLGFASLFAVSTIHAGKPAEFDFKDGDRVVLVGDTFIERDQRYGYLESLLTIQHPDKNLTFRNLGWSGDTVEGVSRSGFDPPEAGFKQLEQQILAAKPTVVILGYGMADSFAGSAGLPRFEQGLNRLLDVVDRTHARVILLSPIAHEDLGRPLPDPAEHNRELEIYTRAIGQIGTQRKAVFIDLFASIPPRRTAHHLTDNGIHLQEEGYRLAARQIDAPLAPESSRRAPRIELGADGRTESSIGAAVDQVEAIAGGMRWRATRNQLPLKGDDTNALAIAVKGLPDGSFQLKIDGRGVETRPSVDWKNSVQISRGPDVDQSEQLRRVVNRKNELFFYRWRPQNNTYLFGFRAHEQGNNAVEIPRFDPLIEQQEQAIGRLKKPAPHLYELTLAGNEVTR